MKTGYCFQEKFCLATKLVSQWMDSLICKIFATRVIFSIVDDFLFYILVRKSISRKILKLLKVKYGSGNEKSRTEIAITILNDFFEYYNRCKKLKIHFCDTKFTIQPEPSVSPLNYPLHRWKVDRLSVIILTRNIQRSAMAKLYS